MKQTVHLIAALIVTLTIALFFLSTALVEAFGSHAAIAQVKALIVAPGLWILIPAIAAMSGSGFALARGRTGRLIERKKRRMPIIAANGILILIPAAILLDRWAAQGAFHGWFYVVQTAELLAGATNLTVLGLNMRDGFRLSGRFRRGGDRPKRR